MNITTIPYGVNNYFSTDLLLRVVPNFEFVRWASVSKDIPQNMTDTIKFRRHGNLPAKTTPVTEGVTPAADNVSVADITAQVKQYIGYLVFTDKVEYTSDDPNLNDWNAIQADQAKDTLDQLTRTEIYAGSSVQYASSATQRSEITSAMVISADEVLEAQTTLKNANSKKLTKMVEPTTKYNTTPINACYIGFIHPNGTRRLAASGNFTPVEKYSSQMGVFPNEVGKCHDVRFIETTQCPVYTGQGSSCDVYATLIIGEGYYGVSKIAGQAMQTIIKPLGSGGTADPANQRGTKAWKAWFVAKRLNELFAVRIEHAV
jgi:N4-gp56 family major capsid protein